MNRSSAFEASPIAVDGRLIFTTPRNRVIALDPETGRELWTFDPQLERGGIFAKCGSTAASPTGAIAIRTRPVHAPRACSSRRSTRG